ncbi:MAG: ParB/RepB/Spo0J family partition protein [Alphaproteobacteria bacterium]|nr:ParB/RepB/Spo0J family partition protein [Alphaproteobacteria bacterium]
MLDSELDELLNDTPSSPRNEDGHKRKSLGRGLEALMGAFDEETSIGNLDNKNTNLVDINVIIPGKFQPRTEFEQEALRALADSIKEKGVLQPLLVRRQGDKYELIAGERRWRASKLAGLSELPVVIKDLSDKEVLEAALVENILRENLSAIEEAEGYQRLIDEFSHTQEALSQVVGKSRSHISNTLRLLTLPTSVRDMIKDGRLSAGHARALVGLDDAELLAQQIVKQNLNVRQVEELVARRKNVNINENQVKTPKEKDEDICDIERELIKSLGLRIKISPNKQGGGKVVLQYASVAELDMIVEVLQQKYNKQTDTQNTVFKTSEVENSDKFSIKIVD